MYEEMRALIGWREKRGERRDLIGKKSKMWIHILNSCERLRLSHLTVKNGSEQILLLSLKPTPFIISKDFRIKI